MITQVYQVFVHSYDLEAVKLYQVPGTGIIIVLIVRVDATYLVYAVHVVQSIMSGSCSSIQTGDVKNTPCAKGGSKRRFCLRRHKYRWKLVRIQQKWEEKRRPYSSSSCPRRIYFQNTLYLVSGTICVPARSPLRPYRCTGTPLVVGTNTELFVPAPTC